MLILLLREHLRPYARGLLRVAVFQLLATTASFYLPALLLDRAGIDDGGYFRLLETVRRGDHPGRDWIPAEDEGLRAIMQLRQRGE